MSGDLTPYRARGDLQPISVQRMMTEALQVFRFNQDFEDAFGIVHEAARLTKVENRKFAVLERATTREARFQVHCDAHNLIDQMPSHATLVSAFRSVKQAMSAKPSQDDLALLVGKTLDVWMIDSDRASDYGESLIWKLSDCPKQTTEQLFYRRKRWLAVPAIAGAFNHLLDTYRPAYGKPPPIPDVLEECGRHSDHLIRLHDEIDTLGQTRYRLAKIIEATDDSYPDDDED